MSPSQISGGKVGAYNSGTLYEAQLKGWAPSLVHNC